MLIGKRGRFTLIAPFTHWSTTGLQGEIVGVNYIKHLVSKGTNVKSTVYTPVSGDNLYSNDYSNNVIIVTIKDGSGKKYNIPDTYIANLYDDSLNYVDAYLTAKIGPLPRNYDYSNIISQMATELSKLTGITITDDDIYISAQDNGEILNREQASLLDIARNANLIEPNTDYGRFLAEAEKNKVLSDKLNTVEAALFDLVGP